VRALLLANLVHLGATALGSLLLLLLLHLQERASSRFLAHRLGWRAVLLTGWLGVPVHELSHIAAAALFGHRIIAWKLFDPDPVSGTLGYVRHAYSRRSPWQLLGSFFIGVAPLAGGAVVLAALLCWMVPPAAWAALLRQLSQQQTATPSLMLGLGQQAAVAIWEHRGPLLPLQIYLAVCVASHVAPSRADVSGALPGAVLLAVLMVGAAGLAAALGASLAASQALLGIMALLLLAAGLFQAAYVASVFLVLRLLGRRSHAASA
jgi:hypothetical protein